MSFCKMAMKTILYFMVISLVSGRPFHPPRANNHPHGPKIPLYMMHLYQTLTGKTKDCHKPGNQVLEESDTVQSLTAKDLIVEDNRWSLTFDFSTVSRNDELRMVELQVYLPPLTQSCNVTVDIYHINNGDDKLFLGSVTTNGPRKQNSSWTTFNVTKMIEQSLLWGNKNGNQGNEDVKSVDKSDQGDSKKIKKRDVSLHEINTDQAIIVFFTKHKPFSKPETPSLIEKLAVNTMKIFAFQRHVRPKSDTQLGTPSNMNHVLAEEHKPSYEKEDILVESKEISPKYKVHSSVMEPVLP